MRESYMKPGHFKQSEHEESYMKPGHIKQSMYDENVHEARTH